jgi:hypothetical protein
VDVREDVQVLEEPVAERGEADDPVVDLRDRYLGLREGDVAKPGLGLLVRVELRQVGHRLSPGRELHVGDRSEVLSSCSPEEDVHNRHLPCSERPSR